MPIIQLSPEVRDALHFVLVEQVEQVFDAAMVDKAGRRSAGNGHRTAKARRKSAGGARSSATKRSRK